MPVKKRKNAKGQGRYRYDFNYEKKRYIGRWGPNRASAGRAEASKLAVLQSGTIQEENARLDFTLNEATDIFWKDVGQHHRSADQIRVKIDNLHRLIGADRLISKIKTSTVRTAINTRREEPVVNKAKQSGIEKALAREPSLSVQDALARRNHALRLIAAGVSASGAAQESRAGLSSCKRYHRAFRDWHVKGGIG